MFVFSTDTKKGETTLSNKRAYDILYVHIPMMTKIPSISPRDSEKHAGESAAIVDGKIVAYDENSFDVRNKAIEMGYKDEDIMTVFIMGPRPYAMHFSLLRE